MVASLAFHVVTATCVETLGKKTLVVQWLGFYVSTAGGMGSVPDQGTKIPQASLPAGRNGTGLGSSVTWGVESSAVRVLRVRVQREVPEQPLDPTLPQLCPRPQPLLGARTAPAPWTLGLYAVHPDV